MDKLNVPEELTKKSDFPKRNLRLYSIAGFFGSNSEMGCAAFGGYFRYDTLSKILFGWPRRKQSPEF